MKKVSLLMVLVLVFTMGYIPHRVTAADDIQATYRTHVQSIGWQNWVYDGAMAGTQKMAKRMESFNLKLINAPAGMGIRYQAHVQSIGWQDWVYDGAMAGTSGKAKRMEALRIELVGAPEGYSVEYRAHVQSLGWQDWVRDGGIAGTEALSKRIEAIEIRIVNSQSAAEGPATTNGFSLIETNSYLNTVEPSVVVLPSLFKDKPIEGVSIIYNNEFIPADIEIKKNILKITPAEHLKNEKIYSVRIFTSDDNQYVVNLKAYDLKSIDFTTMNVVLIPANPEKGFNYPYYLGIPRGADKSKYKRLMVEPNNAGNVNDALEYHAELAKGIVEGASLGGYVSEMLKTPIVVPAFPRPLTDWSLKPYMQFMDRKSFINSDFSEMVRPDLQLTAMIKDAQGLLEKHGLKLEKKVFMTGFSASAKFVQRYTIIHPEMVQATVVGGIASTTVLPVSEYKGTKLRFPVGVNDIEELTGKKFNSNEFKKVAQFMYMGDQDNNDATQWQDCYEEQDSQTIWNVLGKNQLFDRWNNTIKALQDTGYDSSIQFHMYEGIGHGIPSAVNHDALKFFITNYNNSPTKIKATKDAWHWDFEETLKLMK